MRRPVRLTRSVALAAVMGLLTATAAGAADSPAFPGGPAKQQVPLIARQAAAPATTLLPPAGQVFTGVSCGSVSSFAAEVGKHPAIYGEFVNWGQSIGFAFNDAAAAHARLMLHISTGQPSPGHPVITPAQISQGDGDAYLLGLAKLIASHGKPVYIRLFPEMNNASNSASAYNLDGSFRGAATSQTMFIAAWRRVVTVLRGGPVTTIDAALGALGQPSLHGIATGGSVPSSQVSFVWTPETAGTPPIAGNDPLNYYPGNRYVDWVGTDFYSKFPNFTGLNAFYAQFPQKPFAFGEWAIWGGDNPAFVNQLFAWVNAHKRVQIMLYNQGFSTAGPFSLNLFPASTSAIRSQLTPRFLAFTSDWR